MHTVHNLIQSVDGLSVIIVWAGTIQAWLLLISSLIVLTPLASSDSIQTRWVPIKFAKHKSSSLTWSSHTNDHFFTISLLPAWLSLTHLQSKKIQVQQLSKNNNNNCENTQNTHLTPPSRLIISILLLAVILLHILKGCHEMTNIVQCRVERECWDDFCKWEFELNSVQLTKVNG